MNLFAQGVDAALEATGMDAIDALRAFFLLAAATVCSCSSSRCLLSQARTEHAS